MSAIEAFALGVSTVSVFWLWRFRSWYRRIDLDVEARTMALDRERVGRIFDRHLAMCACGRRPEWRTNESAAVRDPEWTIGSAGGHTDQR